jgi:hypothetical protein
MGNYIPIPTSLNPLPAPQVTIELVQASITVSFSLQDPEFPPYRVDNFTSYNIRFRQTASLLSVGSGGAVGGWDYVAPSGSAAYAWDTPTVATGSSATGGSKLLQLEFQQGSRWEQREYSLDELKRHSRVKLSRALPDLSRPLFQGYVDMQRSLLHMGGDVAWRRAFCVLHDAVLYVFADEHKVHLRGVVNLGARGQAPGGRRTLVLPHKPMETTDLFSVLRANLDRTTAKLNAMLLVGGSSEDPQRGLQSRSRARTEVLGMVAYQLGRYLHGAAAKAAAAMPLPSSPLDTQRKQFSSSRSPLLAANQWLGLMVDAGFARDAVEARRLAADLVTTGHLVPLAAPQGLAAGLASPAQRRRSSVAAPPPLSPPRGSESPPFKPRPPAGPPPKIKAGPAPAFIASSRARGGPGGMPMGRGANARRLSVDGGGDVFTPTDTTVYLLVAPQRDADLYSVSVGPEFEIATVFGDKSVFRCPSPADAKRWIQALRDTVDRLAIASVLAPSGSHQRPVGSSNSNSKGGPLGSRWIGALVGDPLAPLYVSSSAGPAAAAGASASSSSSTQIKAKTSVRVQVRCDGPTKVLELVEEHDGEEADEEENATARLRKRRPLLDADGSGGGSRLFQNTRVGVYVRRVGVSLVDDRPQETLYASLEHVNLMADLTPAHVTVSLTVEGLQVDNQLENAGYAVVLAPRAIAPKQRRGDDGRKQQQQQQQQQQHQPLLTQAGLAPRSPDAAPAFHFFARRLNVASRDVVLFESFSCWVRPLELKLEESVLTSLLRMKGAVQASKHLLSSLRAGSGAANEAAAAGLLPPSTVDAPRQQPHVVLSLPPELDGNDPVEALGVVSGDRRQWLLTEAELLALQRPRAELLLAGSGGGGARVKLYFAVLHLHPIDLTVSFKYMALQEKKDEDKEIVALGNVAQLDSARVKLNALLVTDAFGARGHIARTILKHYYWGILKQLHTLLGSFDVLGACLVWADRLNVSLELLGESLVIINAVHFAISRPYHNAPTTHTIRQPGRAGPKPGHGREGLFLRAVRGPGLGRVAGSLPVGAGQGHQQPPGQHGGGDGGGGLEDHGHAGPRAGVADPGPALQPRPRSSPRARGADRLGGDQAGWFLLVTSTWSVSSLFVGI